MSAQPLDGPRGSILPTLRLIKDPLNFYRDGFAKYGDPYLVHALNGDVAVTCSREGAKQILTARPEIYDPFATAALDSLTGDSSLLTLTGAEHMRQRRLVMPAFHGERMRAYADIIVEATRRQLDEVAPGEEFVVIELARAVALEVILRAVFGVDAAEQLDDVAELITNAIESFLPIFFFSAQFQKAPFGLGPWAKAQRLLGEVDEMLYELIREGRAKHAEGEGGDSILAMLIAAEDEDGGTLSDKELRDQLLTLLVAGHETTTTAIAWSIYHLHNNPETLATLRKHLAETDLEGDKLAREPYLKAVGTETLRIFPVIPDFVRQLREPFELLGHTIPAGSCVGVATMLMHHNPEWYPEPMEFRPERFVDSNPDKWAYFPFGGGHRRCVGAALANFELALVTATIVQETELELLDSDLLPVRKGITLAPPTGVRVRRLA